MTRYTIEGWSDMEWEMESPNSQAKDVWMIRSDGLRTRFPRRLLVPVAGARSTDPASAHAAAARQTPDRIRESHRLVLSLLSEHGPMTDFELAERASRVLAKTVKQTSIGPRRSELKKLGYVIDSGTTGPSDMGAESIRWKLTNAGREVA
jgi:hypothetical protein